MLTAQQLELLEDCIESDPIQVALKTGDRELSSQVAVLQKAREKLPSYYAARCYIPQISYEQCTSEIVSANRRFMGGSLALDLTCGLGVDSLALARCYTKVISCEIDSEKAAIAKSNFTRLGIDNVEVVNCSAEDFLVDFSGKADLVFCDPSRRLSTGSKVSALQDCSPNIVALMPRLREVSKNIMVKLSPLFDVTELFNIFGDEIEVETISHNNECKEVVMRLGKEVAQAHHLSVTIIRGENVLHQAYPFAMNVQRGCLTVDKAKYIYIPDVALTKSRTLEYYMTINYANCYLFDSFVLTDEKLVNFAGRGFEVSHLMPYKVKEVRRYLASRDFRNATVHTRNFLYGVGEIRKQLGIVEGSDCELFMFRLLGVPTVVVSGCGVVVDSKSK